MRHRRHQLAHGSQPFGSRQLVFNLDQLRIRQQQVLGLRRQRGLGGFFAGFPLLPCHADIGHPGQHTGHHNAIKHDGGEPFPLLARLEESHKCHQDAQRQRHDHEPPVSDGGHQ